MNKTIGETARLIGAEARLRNPQATVSFLLTDSRQLTEAAGTLFFALRTESNDGHRYIAELLRKGVRHFVVTEIPAPLTAADADFLVVENVAEALRKIAAACRSDFAFPVLAITGSNGKTIVKEWLWQLLRDDLRISRSPGSYNSQIGVALSLSMISPASRLAVIEAGISRPGEMQRHAQTIAPQFGLMTNLGAAHQENFASASELLSEKFRLFESCKALVCCMDDPAVAEAADAWARQRGGCLYGWSSHKNSAAALQFRTETKDGCTFINTEWHGAAARFAIRYTDAASVQNALHCLACIRMLEEEIGYAVEAPVLAGRLEALEPVAMRLDVREGRNGCVLINDTYNSDLQALELALNFQRQRSEASALRPALILSDIYQSGLAPEQLYGRVASLAAAHGIVRFIGIGREISRQAALFDAEARFFQTTEDFLSSSLPEALDSELVLIKGSRRFGFERITERLTLRSHQTVLEVNLDAIVHNYNYFRSLLQPATRLVAMVKAESYGLGAVEISKTLQAHGCDALAVAVADEGVKLRQAGITIPILVMNPEPSVFPICCEYHLEPEVYSFKLLDAFIRSGEKLGIKAYPIHLKMDTGMHRLGFLPEDLDKLLERLKGQEVLRVASIFSHLAGSDEDTFDDYTRRQWEQFEAMSSKITKALPYRIIRHILNSAGIERFPQWQCDQVRLGIGLYGVSVAHPESVRPVASLKTRILQIHPYQKGETIGYSRTTTLQRDARIAVLPIGYADGLNRRNRGQEVLINGRRAPIMGNICMDACMVDVTGIPAEEGDEAVIFGDGLPVSEVAGRIGTIPYEVLTSVSKRVKRIYYKE